MVCVEAARCRYRCCLARCVGVFRALDQKVVNFEQILFANGRRLNLTEGASAYVSVALTSLTRHRKSLWTYGFDLNIHGD
jgi:hypothetical protein